MDKRVIEDLKKFISSAGNVKNPGDLALIIIEKGAKQPSPNTWKKVDKDVTYFAIKNNTTEYLLLDEIIKTQKGKKKLILDIKKDLSSASINLLKKIVKFGKVSVDDKDVDITPGTIISLVDRDFAQKNINYYNFFNLFSSAFSIKK